MLNKNVPIVLINIKGRLGNQLFQIAAGYAYAKKENGQLQIFNNGNSSVYWDNILQPFQPFLIQDTPFIRRWMQQYSALYQEICPINRPGIWLDGFFQTSKYFYDKETIQEIKHIFKQYNLLSKAAFDKYGFLLQEGTREKVVVVHARRTDYLQYPESFNPLTTSYYREAVIRMNQYKPDSLFVLASDDNQYWNEIQKEVPALFQNYIVIDASEIDTFVLLQQFQNFIMSNSSFIWWIVYLSDAKHVITPAKWFGPKGGPHPDIYEPEWEKISF